MEAAVERDDEFHAFVVLRGPALLRAAQYLTADRHLAEDLLQIALTKTYLAWAAARCGEPYAYALRVLVTSNIDRWRRRRWREQPTADPAVGARDRWQMDRAELLADRDVLLRALQKLTTRERRIMVLRYYEDLSERDVARLLEINTGTVKSTASRALAKLRLDPTIHHDAEGHAHARH